MVYEWVWSRDPSTQAECADTARLAVSILLGEPQTPLGAPHVAATELQTFFPLAQRATALSYYELSRPLSEKDSALVSLAASVVSRRRRRRRNSGGVSFSTASSKRARPSRETTAHSVLTPDRLEDEAPDGDERQAPGLGRPGAGGRRPSKPKTSVAQATEAMRALLGNGRVTTHRNGGQLFVWTRADIDAHYAPEGIAQRVAAAPTAIEEQISGSLSGRPERYRSLLSEEGRGAYVVRLSGTDLQAGDTTLSQLNVVTEFGLKQGLAPKYLIVALNVPTVEASWEDRPDLKLIESRADELDWVVYRDIARVSRKLLTAELFYELCRNQGIDLYVVRWGRKVDWRKEGMELAFHTMLGNHEGNEIRSRTHEALQDRFLEVGRGWPGSARFGFRRDAQSFLEVDPEQWPFVKMAHLSYAKLDSAQNGGLTRLRKELEEHGCKMSRERLRTILIDPIYVTGEWHVTYDGTRYAGRTIQLDDPIPLDVFQRNQDLMALSHGDHSLTPVGSFLLNRVPLYHARCLESTSPEEAPPRLRGRGWARGAKANVRPAYYHTPKVPDRCRGFVVDAAILDATVILALRELATSPELQRAWSSAERGRIAEETAIVSVEGARALRAKADRLERQVERLKRDWTERLANGEELDTRTYTNMISPLEEDLDALRKRAELAKTEDELRLQRANQERVRLDERLADQMLEVLTVELPEDAGKRIRRAAFAEAVLSEVIVHDGDDGISIELVGELVPGGSHQTPLSGGISALDNVEGTGDGASQNDPHCSPWWSMREVVRARRSLRRRAERNDFEGRLKPSWRSGLIPLPAPPQRWRWTLDECARAIRLAHDLLPPGVEVLGASYTELARNHDLPSAQTLMEKAWQHGLKTGELVRFALAEVGADAWQAGRVRVPTEDELVDSLARALPRLPHPTSFGFTTEYEHLAASDHTLLSTTGLVKRARGEGKEPADYWEEAVRRADERWTRDRDEFAKEGTEGAVGEGSSGEIPSWHVVRVRTEWTRDACLELIRDAHRRLPSGAIASYERWELYRNIQPDAPTLREVAGIASRTGESPVDLVRAALAAVGLSAWRERRVGRARPEELYDVLSKALKSLPPLGAPGFLVAYDELARSRRELLSREQLLRRARKCGVHYSELFHRVIQESDI